MRLVPFAMAIAFTSALPACSESHTPVTPPPATMLTITGASTVQTGHSTVYSATLLQNGTTRPVTPVWTVSDATVASVTSSGELTGRDHGPVVLNASYQNDTSTKSVQIIHDYDGRWVGQYVVRSCDQSGIFVEADWCGILSPGSVLPIAMDIQSSAGNATTVAVTLMLGTISGTLTGAVAQEGHLSITGPFTVVFDDVPMTITIGDWVTPLSTDHMSMIGGWAQDVRVPGVTGNAYQRNELVSLVRTSSTAAVVRVTPPQVRTWAELFARMRTTVR